MALRLSLIHIFIRQGAEMLGWTLDDLISRTIVAMRESGAELG